MKKTLSIILIAAMLLGVFGTFAFASSGAALVNASDRFFNVYYDYCYGSDSPQVSHNGSIIFTGSVENYIAVYSEGTYNLEFHDFKMNATQNYSSIDVKENITVNIKFYGQNEFVTPFIPLMAKNNSKITIELADNSSVKLVSTSPNHNIISGTVEMKDGSALPAPDANGDITITKGTPAKCTHTIVDSGDGTCSLKCGSTVVYTGSHDYDYAKTEGGHIGTCANCKAVTQTLPHDIYYYGNEIGECVEYCEECDYAKAGTHQMTAYTTYDEEYCLNICANCYGGSEFTGLVKHDFVKKEFAATDTEAAYTLNICSRCEHYTKEYNRDESIYFELESYNEDDWDQTIILVVKNGVPFAVMRNYDGYESENYAIPYDKNASYSFMLIDESDYGEYYGAKIYFPGSETPVFESDDFSEFNTSEILYTHNQAKYDKLVSALGIVPASFESYTKESVDKLKEAVLKIKYFQPTSKQTEIDTLANEITAAVEGLTLAEQPVAHGLINLTEDVEIIEESGKKGYYYADSDEFYEYDGEYVVFDSTIMGNSSLSVYTKASITTVSLWLLNDNGTLTVDDGGDLTLTALGDNWFIADSSLLAGINVNAGGKLTITDKSDSIVALGENKSAGIGSGSGDDAGDITINGGTVFAFSESDGAGIGSGNNGSFGTITIKGGTIHAECLEDDGAGIGVGDSGEGGNIIIDGGKITALSLDDDGAGIGGADEGHTDSITINGGNILVGTDDAACIGGGSASASYGGKIIINGGIIKEHFDSSTSYFIGNDSLNEKGEGEDNFVQINGGIFLSDGKIEPAPKNKDGKLLEKKAITVHESFVDTEITIELEGGESVKLTPTTTDFNLYLVQGTKITNEEYLKTAGQPKDDGNQNVEIVDTTKIFKDVKAGKWYVNAINHCYSYGFIAGMEKDVYGINTNVTRGMFITVLARIAGVDTTGDANKVTTKFSDVKTGKYYTAAIKWASENGVVAGITETEYKPDSPLERQQLCVMIVNFAKYMNVQIEAVEEKITFADQNSIGKYAKEAVEICQKADIINGIASGESYLAKPKDTATRAQAAQMLYVFTAAELN